MTTLRDPILHTHVEDGLPGAHPLADVTVNCRSCERMVHASNNECMTTWIETGLGAYCLPCFAGRDDGVVGSSYGLPRGPRDDETITEWAVRQGNGRLAALNEFPDEDTARHMVTAMRYPLPTELVYRRVTAWLPLGDDEPLPPPGVYIQPVGE